MQCLATPFPHSHMAYHQAYSTFCPCWCFIQCLEMRREESVDSPVPFQVQGCPSHRPCPSQTPSSTAGSSSTMQYCTSHVPASFSTSSEKLLRTHSRISSAFSSDTPFSSSIHSLAICDLQHSMTGVEQKSVQGPPQLAYWPGICVLESVASAPTKRQCRNCHQQSQGCAKQQLNSSAHTIATM